MNSSSFESVQQIFADVFNVPREQVDLQMSPDTLEAWDSIKHLDLVLALEQKLAVQFSPEEISEMTSVEKVIKVINLRVPPP